MILHELSFDGNLNQTSSRTYMLIDPFMDT